MPMLVEATVKSDICLQLWTELAEQLTSGVADYSTTLGDVCSPTTNIYVFIKTL